MSFVSWQPAGDKMSSCLRKNISAGLENPFIKITALKRQYSLSCFTVTLQFDIWIFLILSFPVSSQSDSTCECVCLIVSRSKSPTIPKGCTKWMSESSQWQHGSRWHGTLAGVPGALKNTSLLMWKTPLMVSDLLSGAYRWTLEPGETGKTSTPKCSFQSAFLHVCTHLNNPSFVDSCYRKNVIVILCKYIQ